MRQVVVPVNISKALFHGAVLTSLTGNAICPRRGRRRRHIPNISTQTWPSHFTCLLMGSPTNANDDFKEARTLNDFSNAGFVVKMVGYVFFQ